MKFIIPGLIFLLSLAAHAERTVSCAFVESTHNKDLVGARIMATVTQRTLHILEDDNLTSVGDYERETENNVAGLDGNNYWQYRVSAHRAYIVDKDLWDGDAPGQIKLRTRTGRFFNDIIYTCR